MDFKHGSEYAFELWHKNGQKLADITHLCKNRRYSTERNEADTIEFMVDLHGFERYCASIGTPPQSLLYPLQTDVRVKRNGVYIVGGQVTSTTIKIDQEADIEVRVTGYLNMLKDRLVTNEYRQTDAAEIALDLVRRVQSDSAGDMGIEVPHEGQYLTGKLRDRTYKRADVKDKILKLTNLIDGNFDVRVTPDKKFYTLPTFGSPRTDIEFVVGGPEGNVKSATIERSATSVYNKIWGLGSGFGDDQIVSVQSDPLSINAHYTREKVVTFNSVKEQNTLNQNTAAAVAKYSTMLEIPKITVTGREFDTNYIKVGDYIPVRTSGHSMIEGLNKVYQVQKIEVHLDDNGFEEQIEVYLDDFTVPQIQEDQDDD